MEKFKVTDKGIDAAAYCSVVAFGVESPWNDEEIEKMLSSIDLAKIENPMKRRLQAWYLFNFFSEFIPENEKAALLAELISILFSPKQTDLN